MHNFDDFYREYGESLTERLVYFEMNPLASPFVFVADAASPVEVNEATRSKLRADQTILVWEQFEEQTRDGGRDNVHLQVSGSLAVLRQAGAGASRQNTVARSCRPIALKCLALMLQDSLIGELAINNIRMSFDRNDGGPTISVNGWVGYGYTFSWLVPLNLELTEDDLTG